MESVKIKRRGGFRGCRILPRYEDLSLDAMESPALQASELHLAHPRGLQLRTVRLGPEPTSIVKQAPITLPIRSANTRPAALGPIPWGDRGIKEKCLCRLSWLGLRTRRTWKRKTTPENR